MQNPSRAHMKALKRLGRYFIGKTRYVAPFERQGRNHDINAQSDTDYTGCLKTRKFTGGGIVQLGKHVITTWSATQAFILLFSGAAEYYGMVKAASSSLGIQAIANDMGLMTADLRLPATPSSYEWVILDLTCFVPSTHSVGYGASPRAEPLCHATAGHP